MGPGSSREPPREEVEKAEEQVEAEGLEKTAEESRKEVGVSEEPMEELSRPKQLRLEEEPAEVEEVAAEAVAPEPAGEGVYRLFGHELVEVAGGEVSRLRCVRCGAEAPLTGVTALKGRPCGTPAPGGGFCRVCGRTGITSNYCDECAKSIEEYSLIARPLVDYGRRSVRVLPPEGDAEGWAWAGTHRTFFPYHVREGVRVWPCPACGEEYRRLVDAMEHFAAAHPERTGGFAKEFDLRTRTDYWRSWQGYVCPRCGRLSEDPTKHSCGGGEG
jgi:uncharacterized C2H2 Zn-finger protein